jgi:hypothetical protein
VFNDMSVTFGNFAFPLDARLRYVIREKDIRTSRRQRFAVDIIIEQSGVEAARCVANFTAFEESRISSREAQLAQEALDRHISARVQELADRRAPLIAVAA